MELGISLGLTRLGNVGFSPASLFTAGTVGAWYDPSDYSTLFQDSAGTTPVTAVEQPVGLMLDKSQGLVLGSELVTNGDFSNGTTGWSADRGGSLSVVGGALRVTQGAVTDYAVGYQTVTLVVGQWYRLTVDFVGGTAANVQVGVGTSFTAADATFLTTASSPRTLTVYFAATATTMYVRGSVNVTTDNVYADFDNFSLKALPGNHASQSTSTSRPVLRARYNLALQSETLSNAAWSNGNILNGTRSNGSVSVTTSEGYAYIQQIGTYTTTVDHTISFDVVCDQTINNVPIRVGGTTNVYTLVNLVAGQTQRITLTGYRPVSTYFEFGIDARNAVVPGGSDATGYVVTFNRVDLRLSSTSASMPAYQRIAAATDYATAGFLPYLAFDGTDDSFGTNSINFSATDKMSVCAGVTKLGTNSSILAELSAQATLNNGSFWIGPNAGASNDYAFLLQGTSNCFYSATTFAAPITNVVSVQYDIAGAGIATEIVPRVNAATPTLSASGTTAGTGNFGTYPLFIGRRNNASLPFNGRMYGLIVAGKTLSASELSATESWMAAKTGVTI